MQEETQQQPISKHKIKGKHALKYDKIFKGKKDENENDEFESSYIEFENGNQIFESDSSTSYFFEKENPDEAVRLFDLKNDVYEVLVNKLRIDISTSRRKPSKEEFNMYYDILVRTLDLTKYNHMEIFVDLAYYFSDTIENMFKMLDEHWGAVIAKELLGKVKQNEIPNIDEIDFF